MPARVVCPRRVFGNQRPDSRHILIEILMISGIHAVYSTRQHRHHRPTHLQRPTNSGGVDTLCHAGDHQRALSGQIGGQLHRRLDAVRRGLPGAHHSDGRLVIKGKLPPLPIQHQGRLGNGLEPLRIGGVLKSKQLDAVPLTVTQHHIGLIQRLIHQGADGGVRQTAHHPICLLIGCMNQLRGSEALQHPHGVLPRQPLAEGQPDPVLQIGHIRASSLHVNRFAPSPTAPPTLPRRHSATRTDPA